MKFGEVANISTKMPGADFWLVRVGSKDAVGRPGREYNPNYIGIKVTRTDLLDPSYAYYLFMYLWQRGYWQKLSTGTTNLVNIRVSDVKSLTLQESVGWSGAADFQEELDAAAAEAMEAGIVPINTPWIQSLIRIYEQTKALRGQGDDRALDEIKGDALLMLEHHLAPRDLRRAVKG
jgi:hypothetical protein